MVDVNIEFTKGILFVRLRGILNNCNEHSVAEKVFNIIKEGGIRYLVFNTQEVYMKDDLILFRICEKLVEDNDGKMLICGSNVDEEAYSYEYIENELYAYKLLTV